MKKILIVSDAWLPQINGVVRTLQKTIKCAYQQGHSIGMLHPEMFDTMPMPFYPEIRLARKFKKDVRTALKNDVRFDYVHIPVELGPLGRYARRVCVEEGIKFTTAYHTMFPEYVESKFPIPGVKNMVYKFMKDFHDDSACTMVATTELMNNLSQQGFSNMALWGRGCDAELFNPQYATTRNRNCALYVGRVSVEKNIEAFCQLDLTKHRLKKRVVGDGPALEGLKRKYRDVEFVGAKKGEELAAEYANAAVFVFPSKTDTFGLVLIEALASGTPVAAYDEPNTRSILNDRVGSISDNLADAVGEALTKNRAACREYVLETYTWEKCTKQFINNLVPKY